MSFVAGFWSQTVGFFSNISLDWVILVAFALVIAIDGFRNGLSRASALALALPLTLLLARSMPEARFMGGIADQLNSPLLNTVFVLILLAVVFVCMYRITDTYGADSSHPIQALLAGLAVAVVAVVIWLQIPSLDSVWHFGPQVQALFGAAYRFWWLLIAYIALAFARG